MFISNAVVLLLCAIIGVNLAAVQLNTLTGNVEYNVKAVGDQNTWLITPNNPSASKIMIIFTAMNMRQAEIRIYDTSTVNAGGILFNCASCGSVLPPPFYSTTGSVTIIATAVNGVGFQPSSFTLQFVAAPVTETSLLAATNVKLNMGTAQISPFSYNNILPAGTVQQWSINVGAQLVFSFSRFLFPVGCTAEVQIHNRLTGTSNSSLLFRGCRNSDAPTGWIYSKTGVALVIVKTTTRSEVDFQLMYTSDAELYKCGSIEQPALLADTSMILKDGSLSTDLMQRGVSCTWVIAPAIATPVSLVLNRVSLKFGSSVSVFDGPTDKAALLWNAVGATLTVPPIITSTTSSLYIRYQSDSSMAIRYFGFEGDYASNFLGSQGSGKGYTQLGMSSALDITPPGDGRTHTPGVRYVWYVAPLGATGPITFVVSAMHLLQPGSTLTLLEGVTGNNGGDMGAGRAQNYSIGNRRVLATYSGNTVPTDWVRTSGTSATLIFQTAASSTSAGDIFKMSYFSDGPNYHCGFTTDPAQLTMPSFILTDGSSSTERAYANQFCRWKIQPTNASSVVLVFERFHIFGGYLRVYSGSDFIASKLYVEIGETAAPPAPILIPGGAVCLEYATQAAVTGYGFALTYYGVTSSRSFPGDHVVTLTSASAVSLTLPTNVLAANTSLKWVVAPSGSTGKLYLALSSLNLPGDCQQAYLDVYDGSDSSAPLIVRLCGSALPSPYKWLQTSGSVAMLRFVSDATQSGVGNFDLSYFMDGPNFHCGFPVNPARMSAPSMVITDGSGSSSALFANQDCAWVIEPSNPAGDGTASEDTRIVLEITQCDLTGASMQIFDGASAKAPLLWSCDDCSNIPGPVVSSTRTVYVRYTSKASGTFGDGFRLLYWTASASSLQQPPSSGPRVLELPLGFDLTSSASNASAAFFLRSSAEQGSLHFQPIYATIASTDVSALVADGRAATSVFESSTARRAVCGVAQGPSAAQLVGPTVAYTATRSTAAFLSSTPSTKQLLTVHGTDVTSPDSYEQLEKSMFSAPGVCKYRVESGTLQAVAINIDNFSPQQNGHLLVYGGLNSEDAIMFDSNFPEKYLRWPARYVSNEDYGVWTFSVNLIAPCGQATIILETNTSVAVGPPPLVDYSLQVTYSSIAKDSGQACSAYMRSLQPAKEKDDPTLVIVISCASFAGCCLVFATFYYAGQVKASQGYYFYPYGLQVTPAKKIVKAIPAHPRYSAKWDQYLNRFLRKGECCVCKNTSQVVLRLKCGHAMCLEDIRGYLESALGDVSMFPVKCPMHFQGCEGALDAHVAKRVLTEPQYNRFNEFSDRAAFGDGMRCIFCQNYVNFPESMENVARVVCPYCQQNFCVRCKKAWHKNNRCTVDNYDPSLEIWKNSSGAQKCPACKKLIEKDDPDTCNHMVHKITDGIPCIRERTDFCYCCGDEVTADYPHNEVGAQGVNHFPDGVFQRCRRIVMQEKEAERERLRKARRMKSKIQPLNRPNGAGSDGSTLSALQVRSTTLSVAPPGGNTALESMWLLEQQYDIESPVGSPNRPFSRSGAATPLMTPSPGRVHPVLDNLDMLGLDTPATANVSMRPSPGSSGRFTNPAGSNRIVPASGVYSTTIVPSGIASSAGSSRSAAGSPVRPFPTLEQQMLYQQSAMMATRTGSAGGAVYASPSSPQLLLGSPVQQQRTRFASPARATIV